MPPKMVWLVAVVRLAVAPVFLGALANWFGPQRTDRDVAAGVALAVLGVTHLLYWSGPWPARRGRAVAAAAVMVLTNVVLLHILDLSEPLLWLYPALVVGAGLPLPAAVVGVALMAVAAGLPGSGHGEIEGMHPIRLLGPGHAILLAVTLAGLGMTAVRQLVAVNADLRATRAELADLAVSAERERLARELHDLLGRTLSLIAVKAELASRLSARGDPTARSELGDVQRLARQAVRDVREAVAGDHAPGVDAELAAAVAALRMAGIEVRIDRSAPSVDPAHETAIAWVLREAVTNVVRHSGARNCRISLRDADDVTALEVADDGRGQAGADAGTGLEGLARRITALGGAFEAGPSESGGFRLRVRLGATAPRRARAGATR